MFRILVGLVNETLEVTPGEEAKRHQNKRPRRLSEGAFPTNVLLQIFVSLRMKFDVKLTCLCFNKFVILA